MTSIADKFAFAGPLPVMPIETPPQLSYRSQRDPLPPMIRVGGYIGFLALLLTGLLLPAWMQPEHVDHRYRDWVHLLVPALQLMCAGSGFTLIIVGRQMAGRRVGFGLKLAMTINFMVLLLAAGELKRSVYDEPRWVPMCTSPL
jgi:hypothetical protein